ncbi:hypothetical protein [Candidatus Poriferisocius sp.]|uniref:hypothetical protein n=1 Tax=Candidatus Poriferisocius sp. TaxID=3101276 RepID=UPI003B022FF1
MSKFPASPANNRQRALVLAMPPDEAVPRIELPWLTPELAHLYAGAGPRTLSRDINKLASAGLIIKEGRKCRLNHSVMWSFIAPAASPEH